MPKRRQRISSHACACVFFLCFYRLFFLFQTIIIFKFIVLVKIKILYDLNTNTFIETMRFAVLLLIQMQSCSYLLDCFLCLTVFVLAALVFFIISTTMAFGCATNQDSTFLYAMNSYILTCAHATSALRQNFWAALHVRQKLWLLCYWL